ncbi:MAG TPA: mannitol dehydrogenase family protein [Acidimicrobiales bacterium]|nr:mannitol dehydrogenase family protein [Acidimicrobiales bacterium]
MNGEPGGRGSWPARLSLASLERVPEQYRPAVDPRGLPVRIVHLGLGAFHRAHQAVYTEDAVMASGDAWGICGVTERSPRVLEELGPQDGLYTLCERDGAGESLRVVSSVRQVLWAKEQTEQLLARLADPAVAVVTLTVTEKGYRRDPVTGRLLVRDPEVSADLAGRPPVTVIGQLVEGLARRAQWGGGPVTVLSCDNLPDNGEALRSLVGQYCELRPGGAWLVEWVGRHVTFPSCVVDRIVPAATEDDRARVARRLGLEDLGAVVTEPFHQWVIEDQFAAARPAWERAGAIFAPRIAPYERAKLRLLNGAHSTIAYLGALAGYEFVSDAVREASAIGEVARLLMSRDVAPTLEAPEGLDMERYQLDLMRRFQNPALCHRTLQIAMDGSQKLPQRLLGTIADRRAQGAVPVWASLGVAAWARFVSARRSDKGQALVVDDPLEAEIAESLAGMAGAGAVVDALLGITEIFPPSVSEDKVVRDLLVDLVGRLGGDGAEATAQALTSAL